MNFYLTRRIGTGTATDPHRPDLPDGTSWVGIEHRGVYLLGTQTTLPSNPKYVGPFPRLHDKIKDEVTKRGRTIDELNVWHTGP